MSLYHKDGKVSTDQTNKNTEQRMKDNSAGI